jgi:TrmH family RNA methyltransferase
MLEITSIKNPLIKQIRKLHRAKERHEANLFLLEGTNLLESACKWNYSLATVCYTSDWKQRYPQLWAEIREKAQRMELVTSEVLSAIATTVNPDGVVATAVRQSSNLKLSTDLQLGLVLERLQDPGNLGTIIRTAVATDVDGLWLSDDSVDLDNPKVLRASVGEWFRLPMAKTKDLKMLVESYRQQGTQIVATLPTTSVNYWDLDLTRPTLILLGNEGAGLSPELINLADAHVKIPLQNQVESLNVAITAALMLYEAQRQIANKSIDSAIYPT